MKIFAYFASLKFSLELVTTILVTMVSVSPKSDYQYPSLSVPFIAKFVSFAGFKALPGALSSLLLEDLALSSLIFLGSLQHDTSLNSF